MKPTSRSVCDTFELSLKLYLPLSVIENMRGEEFAQAVRDNGSTWKGPEFNPEVFLLPLTIRDIINQLEVAPLTESPCGGPPGT